MFGKSNSRYLFRGICVCIEISAWHLDTPYHVGSVPSVKCKYIRVRVVRWLVTMSPSLDTMVACGDETASCLAEKPRINTRICRHRSCLRFGQKQRPKVHGWSKRTCVHIHLEPWKLHFEEPRHVISPGLFGRMDDPDCPVRPPSVATLNNALQQHARRGILLLACRPLPRVGPIRKTWIRSCATRSGTPSRQGSTSSCTNISFHALLWFENGRCRQRNTVRLRKREMTTMLLLSERVFVWQWSPSRD